jgi:hypothetical protein
VAEVEAGAVDEEEVVDVAGEERKTRNGFPLLNWAVL